MPAVRESNAADLGAFSVMVAADLCSVDEISTMIPDLKRTVVAAGRALKMREHSFVWYGMAWHGMAFGLSDLKSAAL